eukprot:COSAG05_NODE_166_length_15185_cov_10.343497_2_plen_66_part_00
MHIFKKHFCEPRKSQNFAERAAESGCSAASSDPVVTSIVIGPGIEISGDVISCGTLPLIAERTLS